MPLRLIKKLAAGLGRKKGDGPHWHAPSLIELGHVRGTCFGMDSRGRGLSIWESGNKIWARPLGPAYEEEQGSLSLGEGKEPHIAANLEGRGAMAWILDGVFERGIVGMPFNPSSDDAPSPESLFKTPGKIHHLQVAVDRRGGALVVWSHELDGQWEVLATVFDVRTQAWDKEPKRLGALVEFPLEPRLAMNRKGSATVLWQELSQHGDGLVASFYIPSERSWSDRPVPVVPGKAKDYQVAMDYSGNVMVLWVTQEHRQRAVLEAKLFSAARSEWLETEVLSRARKFDQLKLAMTGTGEALALWFQTEESREIFLHSKAYHAGAWDLDVTRLDTEEGRAFAFSMVLGAKGQAGLLYLQQNAKGSAPIIRTRLKSWGPPTQIAAYSERRVSHPVLGLCPEGIVAQWHLGQEGQIQLLTSSALTPSPKVESPKTDKAKASKR